MNMWIVTDSGNQLFYFLPDKVQHLGHVSTTKPNLWELLEPHMKKISTHKICMSSISHCTV